MTFLLTLVPDAYSGPGHFILSRRKHTPVWTNSHPNAYFPEDEDILTSVLPYANSMDMNPSLPAESVTGNHFSASEVTRGAGHTPFRHPPTINPINGPPPDGYEGYQPGDQPFKSKANVHADSCNNYPQDLIASAGKNPVIPVHFKGTGALYPDFNKNQPSVSMQVSHAPDLECPGDISTYTDINHCSAFIAGELDPYFDAGEVVNLTWEMEGTMTDASPARGIHLIGDYTFDEGTTIITYTATGAGGRTTSCTFTVTISDNQVPRLAGMPGNITVAADDGFCSAHVNWRLPTASDNCSSPYFIRIEGSHRPGDEFPVGSTRVYYRAIDAMGNESLPQSFVVTVEDKQPPVLTLPPDITIACGQPVPPPLSSLALASTASTSSATEANGFDNCSINESSFRLRSQTSSSTRCPYTITRVYEVKDASGNVATAQHRIFVTAAKEEAIIVQEEPVGLKSAMAGITTAIKTGDWNSSDTWSHGVPDATTTAVIPGPYTVTVSGNVTCNDISVESGGGLIISGTNNLTVLGELSNVGNISSPNGKITISGNWANTGTYSGSSNGVVEFTGTGPSEISGITVFEGLKINKATDATVTISGTASTSTGGDIILTSGILTIPASGSLSYNRVKNLTVEPTAQLIVDGGYLKTTASLHNDGIFRIVTGTVDIGSSSGNGLETISTGTFEMLNGTLNIAGRFVVTDGTASISGGTLNLNTIGHNSTSLATLHLTADSKFSMTGGIINFKNPNGTGNLDMAIFSGEYKSFSGGNINIGTGTTSATYKILSQIPFPTYTAAANTNVVLRIPVTVPGSYNFPVKDNSGNIFPVTVQLTSGNAASGAYIEVSTSGKGTIPEGLNSTKFLNRHWDITSSGLTEFNAIVTFNYSAGDLSGGAVADNLKIYMTNTTTVYPSFSTSGNSFTLQNITSFGEIGAAECGEITVSAVSKKVSCHGGSNGELTIYVSGGAGVLTYSWTGPSFTSTSSDLTGLKAGTYSVIVTDEAGCSGTGTFEVTQPVELTANVTSTNVLCYGEASGSGIASATGGTEPYIYSWDTSPVQNTSTATSLTAGTYIVTITDANGCITSGTVNIIQPAAALSATTTQTSPVNCFGGDDGSAIVSVTGGTEPYTYSWNTSPVQNAAAATGLSAGTYVVTITDGNNCITSETVTITQPAAALSATATQTSPVSCFGGNNGSATASATGGTGSYSYSWNTNPMQNSATAIGLSAGTYLVTITDGNSCITSETVMITQPAAALSVIATQTNPVGCSGGANGSATAIATGGTSPYTYLWNTSPIQTSETATGLHAGTYEVTVSDANGCTANTSVIISEPIELKFSIPDVTDVSCTDRTDGKIVISATGGTGTITYSINPAHGIQNPAGTFSGLSSGTYIITATDLNNCIATTTVAIGTIPDITLPTVTTCSSNISVETDPGSCTAIVTYQLPVFEDNCDGSGLSGTLMAGLAPGQAFPVGVTIVTYEYADASGNGPAVCSFTVTVTDKEAPVISCKENILVNNSPGFCYATPAQVDLKYPTAADNCNPNPSVTGHRNDGQALNANYPVGTTTITWTASDGLNTSTCTQLVIVTDNEGPNFSIPPNTTIFNNINCLADRDPSKTGTVSNRTDNCTPASVLATNTTFIDEPNIPGPCVGNYSFVRKWKVTDQYGNLTEKSQIITVVDNLGPVITKPANVTIQCSNQPDFLNPVNTGGYATAIDACSGIVPANRITYLDSGTPGGCSYVITRTWTATDDCGNSSTAVQLITVTDTEKPVVTHIAHDDVSCPGDIPIPDISVITATDNCGTVNITWFDEIAHGLDDQPGYCPSSIERIYRVSDDCGNSIFVSHFINVQKDPSCWPSGTCERCSSSPEFDELGSFYTVDFTGKPAGTAFFPKVRRDDKCCDAKKQEYCASFNVKLDDDAVGVEVRITNPSPAGQQWKLDCGETEYTIDGGSVVCLPGGKFHLFTYCASGSGNPDNPNSNRFNDWEFISYAGVVVEDQIETRVNCNTQIISTGVYSNPVWTSLSPGIEGQYNNYLYAPGSDVPGSGINVSNPIFIAPQGAVGEYTFQLCAATGVTSLCDIDASGRDCDILTITVKDEILIQLDYQPDLICKDDLPFILTPAITPLGADYTIEWYTGHGANPNNYIKTGSSHEITSEGEFSIKVIDKQDGIDCSSVIFDFNTEIDHTGPTFPDNVPDPLTISCDQNDWQQEIINWLSSFTATYTDAEGNIKNAKITNNFSFDDFDLSCHIHEVEFIAEDQCENPQVFTTSITVVDTESPKFIICPSFTTNVADADLCLIQEIILESPVATDNCGTPSISWEKTGATLGTGTGTATGPFNVGVTFVTYTATDDCGNKATCIQQITIIDTQPPDQINCPEDIFVRAPAPGCVLENFSIPPPTFTDNCGNGLVKISWELSGDTKGSGEGVIDNVDFNVGITFITYYLTDPAGNVAECSFTITIDDEVPPILLTCVENHIEVTARTGFCDAYVTLPIPTAEDPCGQTFTIEHDVEFLTDKTNATGYYPVGEHTVTWTIRDVSGNESYCKQTVTVIDNQPPTITCPVDFPVQANENQTYASDVNIPIPTNLHDNCSYTLSWIMTGSTTDNSNNYPDQQFVPSPYPQLNLGENIITYTVTDASGNSVTCSFVITVRGKPQIECPEDITNSTEIDLCSKTLNPGVPVLKPGSPPADEWHWVMTGETTGSGYNSGSEPTSPGSIKFNTGITTITWTACNITGCSEICEQIIKINDTEAPTFSSSDYENCVDMLHSVIYNPLYPNPVVNHWDPNLQKNPSPDYFTFVSGSIALDIEDLNDNCCEEEEMTIHWRIDFTDTPDPLDESKVITRSSILGTDLPSKYGQILFPADGVTFKEVIHTITYWVIDCHGNKSAEQERNIVITPRPQIIKVTGNPAYE